MRELTAVRDAVIDALQEAGLTALPAFPPERAKEYPGAAAAVGVAAAESKVLGFCGYLGEAWDEASGTVRELYGKHLEGDIAVDLRAARASDCEAGCALAAEVLLGRLPAGIRPGELSWEALCWERETRMFLRRGHLKCRAVFIAQAAEEDGPVFLDFQLKGVMSK